MKWLLGRDAVEMELWDGESRFPVGSVSIPSWIFLRGDPALSQNSMFDFAVKPSSAQTELGPLMMQPEMAGQLHVRISSIPFLASGKVMEPLWYCRSGDHIQSGSGDLLGVEPPVKVLDYRQALRNKTAPSETVNRVAEAQRVIFSNSNLLMR